MSHQRQVNIQKIALKIFLKITCCYDKNVLREKLPKMLPFGQLKKDGKGSKKTRQKFFPILQKTENKKENELRVVCTVLPNKNQ